MFYVIKKYIYMCKFFYIYKTIYNYGSFNSTGFSSEEDASSPKYRKRTCMNQPHLRFEITSDDGFSVKANSIEGKSSWITVLCSHYE